MTPRLTDATAACLQDALHYVRMGRSALKPGVVFAIGVAGPAYNLQTAARWHGLGEGFSAHTGRRYHASSERVRRAILKLAADIDARVARSSS